jgi:hypothetical protein
LGPFRSFINALEQFPLRAFENLFDEAVKAECWVVVKKWLKDGKSLLIFSSSPERFN